MKKQHELEIHVGIKSRRQRKMLRFQKHRLFSSIRALRDCIRESRERGEEILREDRLMDMHRHEDVEINSEGLNFDINNGRLFFDANNGGIPSYRAYQ
jgi:hypothetical protein